MDKPNLIEYKTINKILEDNHFYGFTVHRENERISYKYRSVRFYAIVITVTTMRFKFDDGSSEKYVLFIDVNDKRANDIKEFHELLKGLHKMQNKERTKFYKEV